LFPFKLISSGFVPESFTWNQQVKGAKAQAKIGAIGRPWRQAVHRATGVTYAVKSLRVRPGGENSEDDSDDEHGSDDDNDDEDDDGEDGDSSKSSDAATRRIAAMTMEEVTNELIMMQQLSVRPVRHGSLPFDSNRGVETPWMTWWAYICKAQAPNL
jgi:hypothetical protein